MINSNVVSFTAVKKSRLSSVENDNPLRYVADWIDQHLATATVADARVIGEVRNHLWSQQRLIVSRYVTAQCANHPDYGSVDDQPQGHSSTSASSLPSTAQPWVELPGKILSHLRSVALFEPLLRSYLCGDIKRFIAYSAAYYERVVNRLEKPFTFMQVVNWLEAEQLVRLKEVFVREHENLVYLTSVEHLGLDEVITLDASKLPPNSYWGSKLR